MVTGAVGGFVAAAVNNGTAWSGLGRDDKAFAAEVNVPVAGAAVSPGGDKHRVTAGGGGDGGLDGCVLGGNCECRGLGQCGKAESHHGKADHQN